MKKNIYVVKSKNTLAGTRIQVSKIENEIAYGNIVNIVSLHPISIYGLNITNNNLIGLNVSMPVGMIEPEYTNIPSIELIEAIKSLDKKGIENTIKFHTTKRKLAKVNQQSIANFIGTKYTNVSAIETLHHYSTMMVAKYVHAVVTLC